MSRLFSIFAVALTFAVTVFVAGCGQLDGSITPPAEGEYPTLSLTKITDGDGVVKYRVESNKAVARNLAVLVEEGSEKEFIIIAEGESTSQYFVLRTKVSLVDAKMRKLEHLPAVSKSGWDIDEDTNFANGVYDIDPDAESVS